MADIRQFQLSLHADGPELEQFIRRLGADTVVLNHGDSGTEIQGWIAVNASRFSCKMVGAEPGGEVVVD